MRALILLVAVGVVLAILAGIIFQNPLTEIGQAWVLSRNEVQAAEARADAAKHEADQAEANAIAAQALAVTKQAEAQIAQTEVINHALTVLATENATMLDMLAAELQWHRLSSIVKVLSVSLFVLAVLAWGAIGYVWITRR